MLIRSQYKTSFHLLKEVLPGCLFLLVFAVIPILALQIARYKINELQINKSISESILRHEKILSKIKQADDHPSLICRSVQKVFEKIRNTDDLYERRQRLKFLQQSFTSEFDIFVFSEKNKLLKNLSSARHPTKAMELAMEALAAFAKGIKVQAGKLGILKNIVGLTELPGGLKTKNVPYLLGNRKIDSHFFWNTLPRTANDLQQPCSFIVLMHGGNFAPNKAIKLSLDWVNNRYKKHLAGQVNIEADAQSFYPPAISASKDLRTNLLKSEYKYEHHFRASDYFCTFIKRSLTEYLVIVEPVPSFFSKGLLISINLLCIFWFFLVLKNIPLQGRQIGGKITAKLLFLFLFAIGTPSFALLIGGYYALQDHSQVLQQELERKIVNKLSRFDEKYPQHLANLAGFLKDIVLRAQKSDNLEALKQILSETRAKKDLFIYGFLIDEQGKEYFHLKPERKSRNEDNKKIITLVARELLSRLNKSMKVDSGTLMMEATEDFFSSIGGKNFDFNNLIRQMGDFVPVTFGSEGSYLFAQAIFDKGGKARYSCIFVANRPVVARHYLRRNIDTLVAQQDFSWKVNARGTAPLARDVLTTPHLKNKVMQISKLLLAKNTPVKDIQASGSRQLLWYGKKAAHLQDYALIAMTSLEPLKKELELKWRYLIYLAGTIFIMTAFIGLTLSNQFLKPIENLTDGVKAIEKRDFNARIPVLSNDELGNLSQLLNTVIEGMKDLEVASIVQNSLFPTEKIDTDQLEIYGQSRAMTDIGGDYFDYYFVKEKRIIGLVGDVSGHGISAALVMGMAKFAFTAAETADRPLCDTMQAFNQFLISNIKRKKMMTMFLYSLDLESFCMEFSCAGHNPPMLYRCAEDDIQSIETVSFPLGIRARAKYSNNKLNLLPGDKILFYTDGLVEATNTENEMIGYKQAREWFADCKNLGAEETVTRLFALFDQATHLSSAEDDISLIALQRKK